LLREQIYDHRLMPGQRLDEAVLRIASWMTAEFKQPTPAWKFPSAGFGGVKDGSYLFRMVFYVDNIELEHFERQSRVEGQVRREAYRRLRQESMNSRKSIREIAEAVILADRIKFRA